MAEKIEAPTRLRERAYDKFKEHLLTRELRAGQFVSQRELVTLTGLSLGAIRELIPRLEADGLLKTVPQRGLQIAHVDVNLIRDAFQYRLILERAAIEQFTATASSALVRSLRESHEKVIATCQASSGGEKNNSKELIITAEETDFSLHIAVIDCLNNAIISEAYRVNHMKIRLIRQEQTSFLDGRIIPAMEEHLAVIDAVEKGDVAGAVDALTKHIRKAEDRALGRRSP